MSIFLALHCTSIFPQTPKFLNDLLFVSPIVKEKLVITLNVVLTPVKQSKDIMKLSTCIVHPVASFVRYN